MSVELIDKEVSTDDLDVENVIAAEEKENQDEMHSKEKEKKENSGTDLQKFEGVLSVLVENKVSSIRNCGKKYKEKKLFIFNKFKNKFDQVDTNATINCQSDNKIRQFRTNSSANLIFPCNRYGCRANRCRSLVPCDVTTDYCKHHGFAKYSHNSTSTPNDLYPQQQSFGSYDASLYYQPPESPCCGLSSHFEPRLDRKKLSQQKCLPKQLSTEQWLNSTTSRQTSTETATTSSGYISPTFGGDNRKHRSKHVDEDVQRIQDSTEGTSNGDGETIIDMSKIQAQKTLDAIQETIDDNNKTLTDPTTNELVDEFSANNSNVKPARIKCNRSCHVFLPQCLSTTCLPSCRFSMVDDQGCYNDAPYRHLHPSGGHYMSCYNSPTHSFQ